MQRTIRIMELARKAMANEDCSISDTENDPGPMDDTDLDPSYVPSPDMFDCQSEQDRPLTSLDNNADFETTEPENVAQPSTTVDGDEVGGRKKKGRRRQYGGQDRDERKKCKYSHKDYFNYKKENVPGKVFVDVNCKCTMKCQKNIPLEIRQNEYKNFVELGSYESQNLFIASKVTEMNKKRAYSGNSKRNFTRVYKLNQYSVCRDMFVKTLQISTKRVNTI